MITRPMLAATVKNVDQLRFPLIATPKIDGIRALKVDGRLLSRSFKPIPNVHIRSTLERALPDGVDGELLSGNTFQDCTSAVMTHLGASKFQYWIFDYVTNPQQPYVDRLRTLCEWFYSSGADSRAPVRIVPTTTIYSLSQLLAYEARCLEQGFEGVCLRSPDSPYKCGRSTFKQHWLLKLKRFLDAEAEVIGSEPLYTNTNEPTRDELGLTRRSAALAGKVELEALGKLLVRDIATRKEFALGSGFTQGERLALWEARDSLLGRVVKYKYLPHGQKDLPRHPVFLGFRSSLDL